MSLIHRRFFILDGVADCQSKFNLTIFSILLLCLSLFIFFSCTCARINSGLFRFKRYGFEFASDMGTCPEFDWWSCQFSSDLDVSFQGDLLFCRPEHQTYLVHLLHDQIWDDKSWVFWKNPYLTITFSLLKSFSLYPYSLFVWVWWAGDRHRHHLGIWRCPCVYWGWCQIIQQWVGKGYVHH